MAIFSRRIIQKCLDANRLILERDQTQKHINLLNQENDPAVVIATEWEVVIINALSKKGQVLHEKEFKNGSARPDIYFTTNNIEFVADITTISDKSYNDNNPADYFCDCIYDYFKKIDAPHNGLSISIGNKENGPYGNKKVKLLIPDKNDIPSFIKNELRELAYSIKNNPSKLFKKIFNSKDISIHITYTPNQEFSHIDYRSYNTPYSLTKNPLLNRLKNKNEQIKKSKYEGVAGVFVCDGDCSLLNRNDSGLEEYSKERIIDYFFRNNTTLSFVIVVSIDEQYNPIDGKRNIRFKHNLYENQYSKRPSSKELKNILDLTMQILPNPQCSIINAINHMNRNKNKGRSLYGGLELSANRIKLPSRMITEFFAGRINYDKLNDDYKRMINEFFDRQIKSGGMIDSIDIEKCSTSDDDWVIINYNTNDPAISKYK